MGSPDSSGTLFTDIHDSSLTYFIGKDYQDYRLWKKNTLILTGNLGGRIFRDYFQKFGEWKEYYQNGKIRAVGHYNFDNPIGVWTYYYPNGKKKKWFTITKIETDSTTSYCKTGQFEDFYENGNIKLRGFYKLSFDTMVIAWTTIDTSDSEKFIDVIARGHRSKPDHTWTYYKINGELERTENY